MSRSRTTLGLPLILFAIACGDAGAGSASDSDDMSSGTHSTATSTGAGTTSATSSTSVTSSTASTGEMSESAGTSDTDAPVEGEVTAVLIGGSTRVCTSASSGSNCAGAPDFRQQTELPLMTEDGPTYRFTDERLAALAARDELTPAIQDGLAQVPAELDYTYDELLDALDLHVGLELVPYGSVERSIILGYTANRLEEVVDLSSSQSPSTSAMFERVVAEAAARGDAARIGVVTAASGDGRDSYLFYRQVFAQAGADEVRWIPVDLAYRDATDADDCAQLTTRIEQRYQQYDTPRRYPELSAQQLAACQDPQALIAEIEALTGVFFSGGDQSRHKQALVAGGQDTPELAAIRALVSSGATVVAGSSAGTAVQPGPPMIAAGESYNALVWGPKPEGCDPPGFDICIDDLLQDAEGGLGLFTHGLIDSHFSARGRVGRITRLAVEHGRDWAFGVDETTALVLDERDDPPTIEVIGDRGVQIVDLRDATLESADPWTLRGARVSYLTRGDVFDLERASVTFAADKVDIAGDETYVEADTPSEDIFSSPNNQGGGGRANPREFIRVTQDLCDSEVATTYALSHEGPALGDEFPLRYRVDMTKQADTRCFDGPAQGDVAYARMLVDITPE